MALDYPRYYLPMLSEKPLSPEVVTGLFIFLHFYSACSLAFLVPVAYAGWGFEAEILHPLKEGQNKLRSQESSRQLARGAGTMSSGARAGWLPRGEESCNLGFWLKLQVQELLVHHVMPSQAAIKKPPCRRAEQHGRILQSTVSS